MNLSSPLNGTFSIILFALELLIFSASLQLFLMLKEKNRHREADKLAVQVINKTFQPTVDIEEGKRRNFWVASVIGMFTKQERSLSITTQYYIFFHLILILPILLSQLTFAEKLISINKNIFPQRRMRSYSRISKIKKFSQAKPFQEFGRPFTLKKSSISLFGKKTTSNFLTKIILVTRPSL